MAELNSNSIKPVNLVFGKEFNLLINQSLFNFGLTHLQVKTILARLLNVPTILGRDES